MSNINTEQTGKLINKLANDHRNRAIQRMVSYLNVNGHWVILKLRKIRAEFIYNLFEVDQIKCKIGISTADRKVSVCQEKLRVKEAQLKALIEIETAPEVEQPNPFWVPINEQLKQTISKTKPIKETNNDQV